MAETPGLKFVFILQFSYTNNRMRHEYNIFVDGGAFELKTYWSETPSRRSLVGRHTVSEFLAHTRKREGISEGVHVCIAYGLGRYLKKMGWDIPVLYFDSSCALSNSDRIFAQSNALHICLK